MLSVKKMDEVAREYGFSKTDLEDPKVTYYKESAYGTIVVNVVGDMRDVKTSVVFNRRDEFPICRGENISRVFKIANEVDNKFRECVSSSEEIDKDNNLCFSISSNGITKDDIHNLIKELDRILKEVNATGDIHGLFDELDS